MFIIKWFMRNKIIAQVVIVFFCFNTALYCQELTDSEKLNSYNDAGYDYMFVNRDSAYVSFENAFNLANKLARTEDALDILGTILYTNGYYSDIVAYRKNLNRLTKMISELDPSKDSLDIPHYQNKLLLDTGIYFYSIDSYTKAENYLKELIEKLDTLPKPLDRYQLNHYRTALIYLGAIFNSLQKYDIAESYYQKQIHLCLENKGVIDEWEKNYYNTKGLLSDLYLNTKQFDKAENELNQAIEFYKTQESKVYNNSLISSFFKRAQIHLTLNRPKKSINDLQLAEELLNGNTAFEINYFKLKGDCELHQQKYDEAEKSYREALQKTLSNYNQNQHQEVATMYLKLGDLEIAKNSLNQALQFYQKALFSNSLEFDDKEISENPKAKNSLSKTQLLSILRKKVTVLNKINKTSYSEENTTAVDNTSKALLNTLDALRPEFESTVDKQFLIEETYPAFHEMIDASFNAYGKTKDERYLENAFCFMEKSKSVLLLESIKNTRAIEYGDIPQALIEKEQQIRTNKSQVEKKIIQVSDTEKVVLKDSLFNIATEYYKLIEDTEKNYPSYYRLKYDTTTIGLKQLQQNIAQNETVLFFHFTLNDLYGMAISKEEVLFKKIPVDKNLKRDIEDYYVLLSKRKSTRQADLFTIGNRLYNSILHLFLEYDTNEHLVVVADGLLSYIPFGSFVTDSQNKQFLMQTKQIRYASSATLLFSSKNRLDATNKLLAVAPSFKSNSTFDELPFAAKEAATINTYFDGKILDGNQATASTFIKEQHNYSILHLATHTIINEDEPDYSYLAFSGNTDNRLFIKDLYNCTINADLVTLSACETGIGTLKKGEGMISLARGFQYAGVESLTTTLWRNNDQVTSEIMGLYYKFLKNGDSKSKALQKAKLAYLNTVQEPELKHPYYWAGFIVIGNNEPLSSSFNWYWIIAIGLLLVILVVFRRKLLKFTQ